MRSHVFWLLLALAASVSSRVARADDPPRSSAPTTIRIGDVSYALPFSFPSAEEILRALPGAKPQPKNPRIQCELTGYRLDNARFFPLVGPAQLSHAHFKCTVFTDRGSQVVHIDRDALIVSK